MSYEKTRGLIAAPPTPFGEDGDVEFDVIEPMADFLHENGVSGVFVNGTTGEGPLLAVRERRAIAQTWRDVLPEDMKMFVHVGYVSLEDSILLSEHAESIGVDAIGAMPSPFFQPDDVDVLTGWCEKLAAAADLPFYLYHMPELCGVNVSICDFLQTATGRVPNLAGVKFTYEAMNDYMAALRLDNGRFDLLWGRDEMLLGALAMGAEGAVGSTYNCAAPLYLNIIKAFEAGDFDAARELQHRSIRLIDAMAGTGHCGSALKSLMARQGVPIKPYVRSPQTEAPEDVLAALELPDWA
ncbi:MAG: dihydrodipicolinate synthase family protein [Candidatus Brocadiia bacterium]